MNDELEGIWKETIVPNLRTIHVHVFGWTEELQETLVRIAGAQPGNRTQHLPNTSLERCLHAFPFRYDDMMTL
jgi:hypothetical protein